MRQVGRKVRHTPEGSQQHRRRIGLVRSGGRRASPTYVQFESVAGVDILPKMTPVAERRWNWLLWAGFLLSVLAFFSYFFFFAQFPLTRNFPWANLLLFAFAAGFLAVGIRRAFRRSELYRGKVLGPILVCRHRGTSFAPQSGLRSACATPATVA